MHEYGVPILFQFPESNGYAAIILTVAHDTVPKSVSEIKNIAS
jgi:hypothetical protein